MNTIEKKSVNAGKCTTKQEVDNLIRAYKQESWADNSERIGKADSLSVWFSVEELENFMETVKANGGNGVRMHFGVYTAENAPEPDFEGRQTLVMVGNRSSDGTFDTSKEFFSSNNGQAGNRGFGQRPFLPALLRQWYFGARSALLPDPGKNGR